MQYPNVIVVDSDPDASPEEILALAQSMLPEHLAGWNKLRSREDSSSLSLDVDEVQQARKASALISRNKKWRNRGNNTVLVGMMVLVLVSSGSPSFLISFSAISIFIITLIGNYWADKGDARKTANLQADCAYAQKCLNRFKQDATMLRQTFAIPISTFDEGKQIMRSRLETLAKDIVTKECKLVEMREDKNVSVELLYAYTVSIRQHRLLFDSVVRVTQDFDVLQGEVPVKSIFDKARSEARTSKWKS